jgi:small subunit ribosomal protein S6
MAKKKDTARVVDAVDKKYELMLVLQPELLESATEKKLKDFEKYLEENGGKVEMKDNWGKKKLAYKIGKYDAGTYIVYNVSLPTTFNKELDEHMRIDKDIIRFLHVTLKDDYKYKKFEEEVKAEPKKEAETTEKKEDTKPEKKPTKTTHKASPKEVKPVEIKDKGKKADAESLDDKLDKLLEGDDINI